MAGAHVFEDGRLGLMVVDVGRGLARLSEIRQRMPYVTDLFLPGSQADATAKQRVLAAGFIGCHGWWAVDGATADAYAQRVLGDVQRWSPGAGDLNIELATDAALEPFMRRALGVIRAAKRNYRLRLNVAWRKGGFLPLDLLESDGNLYAAEQNYVDPPSASMSPTSAADALLDLVDAGVPVGKAAVCYGAAGPVGGKTSRDYVLSSGERVTTLPHGGGWTPRRGVIFQDDLCADVGLL